MKKPFWLVALILAAEIFVILIFVPGNWTESVVRKETRMVQQTMGTSSSEWINDKASGWYNSTMVDSGVYRAMYRFIIPSEAERQSSRGLQQLGESIWPWAERRLYALMQVAYQICTRIALLSVWAPYVLVILIPAVIHGWLRWKIKRTNFDYASPVIHRYGIRGILVAAQLMLILFVAPIALYPLIIPFGMIIMAVMFGLAIGNIQKRI